MTREQSAFIQILSDHLNGSRTEEMHGLDWNVLLEYARSHQVTGIVYAQAKAFIPPEVLGSFRNETFATCLLQASREEAMAEIGRMLAGAGIPYFVVKGPLVAELYPVPELRAMSDVDLVVHPEDREACHRLLEQAGYRCATRQSDREWQYYRNSLEIELHDRLVYKEAVNDKGQEEYFNACWEHVTDGRPDWNFHLLFLVFHLRKHLMNSGVGFRQFMDLAVAAEKAAIDWNRFRKDLAVTGMLDFAQNCFGFLDRWFGIRTELSKAIDDGFYDSATQKIFADGIFGFDNEENSGSEVINRIRKKRFPKLGMIRMAMCQVFPSRSKLENVPPYTYLQKSRLLLPVAWVHRMIRGNIKKKEKDLMVSIRQSFTTSESIDKRKEMLQKWGLS